MRWTVEMTDTFGGQANYCWVKRDEIDADTASLAIRRFKAKHGIKANHKIAVDTVNFRRVDLIGACVCIMAYWGES